MSQARPWSGTRLKIESLIFPLQLMPWRLLGSSEWEECNSFGIRTGEVRLRGYIRPPTQGSCPIAGGGNRDQAQSPPIDSPLVSEALLLEQQRRPCSSRLDVMVAAPLASSASPHTCPSPSLPVLPSALFSAFTALPSEIYHSLPNSSY